MAWRFCRSHCTSLKGPVPLALSNSLVSSGLAGLFNVRSPAAVPFQSPWATAHRLLTTMDHCAMIDRNAAYGWCSVMLRVLPLALIAWLALLNRLVSSAPLSSRVTSTPRIVESRIQAGPP